VEIEVDVEVEVERIHDIETHTVCGGKGRVGRVGRVGRGGGLKSAPGLLWDGFLQTFLRDLLLLGLCCQIPPKKIPSHIREQFSEPCKVIGKGGSQGRQ